VVDTEFLEVVLLLEVMEEAAVVLDHQLVGNLEVLEHQGKETMALVVLQQAVVAVVVLVLRFQVVLVVMEQHLHFQVHQ
jgi:hypothetical protein